MILKDLTKKEKWFHWRILPKFKELTLVLHNLFQKIEKKGILPKSFYQEIITKTIPRQYSERKLQINVSHERRHKNPQKNINKPNSTIYYTLWLSEMYSKYSKLAQNRKLTNRIQRKSKWLYQLTQNRHLAKIQYSCMIKKILSKIVTERNFPNLMKSIYQTNKKQKNTTHRKYNT